MEVWSDIGSTCKFRNARSAFRNLHVDPLSLHTSMRNKQVEFNPYIYTLTTLSQLYRFGYEISVFLIQNTRSLFYGRHYSSLHRLMSLHRKLNVKIFLMFIVAESTGSVNIYMYIAEITKSRSCIPIANVSTHRIKKKNCWHTNFNHPDVSFVLKIFSPSIFKQTLSSKP